MKDTESNNHIVIHYATSISSPHICDKRKTRAPLSYLGAQPTCDKVITPLEILE